MKLLVQVIDVVYKYVDLDNDAVELLVLKVFLYVVTSTSLWKIRCP